MLYSVHTMLATFSQMEELAITKDEAKQVAEAIAEVTALYDVPIVNERTAAWFNLALAVGSVYGTRAVVLANAKRPKRGPEIIKPATPAPPSVFHPQNFTTVQGKV